MDAGGRAMQGAIAENIQKFLPSSSVIFLTLNRPIYKQIGIKNYTPYKRLKYKNEKILCRCFNY
jgi:hypothetical protein